MTGEPHTLQDQEKPPYGEEFFIQHRNLIFSICMKYVKDRGIAEDLTQETFIKFFPHAAP